MIKKIIILLAIVSLIGCTNSDDTKITTIYKPEASWILEDVFGEGGRIIQIETLETLVINTDNMPIAYKVVDTIKETPVLSSAIFLNNYNVFTSFDLFENAGSMSTTPLIEGTIPLELGTDLNYYQTFIDVRYTLDGGKTHTKTTGDSFRKAKLNPGLKVIKVEFHNLIEKVSGNRTWVPDSVGRNLIDSQKPYNDSGTEDQQMINNEGADVIMNQCSIFQGRLNFRYVPPEEHNHGLIDNDGIVEVDNGRLITPSDFYWRGIAAKLNSNNYHVFWVDKITDPDPNKNTAGFAGLNDNWMVLEKEHGDEFNEAFLRKLFVHEFGHSQGWDHTTSCNGTINDSVMCDVSDGIQIPTTACERYSMTGPSTDSSPGSRAKNYND